MSWRGFVRWSVLAAILWLIVFGLEVLLVTPGWSSHILAGLHFFLFPLSVLPGLGVAVVALHRAARRPYRPSERALLALLGVSWLALTILGVGQLERIRLGGFFECGQRLEPLVSAIQRYERDSGRPPAQLAVLVPEYLPQVPSTDLGAYSEIEYWVADPGRTFDGNDWMLAVPAFRGSWDQMIFLPRGNYPSRGYGGSIERVGEWAYVFE